MFFGPFLPIVPLLALLEQLPENIGNPIQEALTDGWAVIIQAINAVLSFMFPFLY